jgi:hypothetical protein
VKEVIEKGQENASGKGKIIVHQKIHKGNDPDPCNGLTIATIVASDHDFVIDFKLNCENLRARAVQLKTLADSGERTIRTV